ncbi:erythrocyte membrane protein 1, PfEMP1, putative [Plasmodium reichenowi]|uniref:Erythrocyte membrane protein 1, PfEMP1, putative n=1 Tax=Plasmodium reichenowi TaxID=5854 RepID=A0A2P9DSV4_PLARE|nr:erythrocyte membrane protein 1, PfEMP1, putative [Plasmodium reichenowi]
MLRVLEIPQNDYGMPTKLSSNRYTPYKSAQYRGKRYIYLEGDSGTDSGYTDHYSDITSSSESEYEEFDINDIYVPHAPKYKTLIEVVLEPSKRDTQGDMPGDARSNNPITEEEWNELKQHFISGILENAQKDLPNDYTSANTPMNTQPNTLYFDKPEEKSFIMSIHDKNLLSGEEYSYDMLSSGNNELYSGIDTINGNNDLYSGENNLYSGIDLINDSLNSGNHDIYDEILKRKENELFGTEHHPKRTTTNIVAKLTNSDPIMNQLDLFHKWLDRHRNMCEKWDKNNKVDILNKLKEEWENETHSGDKHSNIPSNIPSSDIHPSDIHSGKLSDMHSGKLSDTPSHNNIHSGNIHPSDIPSGKLSDTPSDNNIHSDIHPSDIPSDNNIHSDIPHVLNTDVSIQIDMDNPKTTNEFTYVDSNPNQVENQNPNLTLPSNPNFVENINPNLVENPTNPNPKPNHVQIQMSVKNTQMMNEKYPIGDVWDI